MNVYMYPQLFVLSLFLKVESKELELNCMFIRISQADVKRTCPAVSQSWRRTTLSSRYMVFERKSIPIVACSSRYKVAWWVSQMK